MEQTFLMIHVLYSAYTGFWAYTLHFSVIQASRANQLEVKSPASQYFATFPPKPIDYQSYNPLLCNSFYATTKICCQICAWKGVKIINTCNLFLYSKNFHSSNKKEGKLHISIDLIKMFKQYFLMVTFIWHPFSVNCAIRFFVKHFKYFCHKNHHWKIYCMHNCFQSKRFTLERSSNFDPFLGILVF